jgi:hypothetical protein
MSMAVVRGGPPSMGDVVVAPEPPASRRRQLLAWVGGAVAGAALVVVRQPALAVEDLAMPSPEQVKKVRKKALSRRSGTTIAAPPFLSLSTLPVDSTLADTVRSFSHLNMVCQKRGI